MKSTEKLLMGRRAFIRNSFIFGACVATSPLLSQAAHAAGMAGQKPLVAYYSRSGHTEKLAEEIHKIVGGAMVKIETVEPYPADYTATTEKAKEELNTNARPAIKTTVPDMDSYTIVFLGYPNWWSSMPMPVYTFIEQMGLNGKTIAPFSTNGGGGLGNSIADLKKLCPNSKILPALAINGNRVASSGPEVAKWLNDIGAAL